MMLRRFLSDGWRTSTSLCALVLAGCAFVGGCKKDAAVPEVVVAVQAQKPVVGVISEQILGDAILAPLAETALSPKIGAPVKQFYVQRGTRVRVGQLLVSLEDKDLQAAAMDNRGTYDAAQGTYQQTTAMQVPEDVQKAELDVKQTKANLDLNKAIVASRTQLFNEGAIPGRDLDTAKAALVQAQVAYDTAEKHLQEIERVGRGATNQAAQGQLLSAKGKLLNAEAMAGYASLRSPIDGVVTDRPLFAGEMAAVGVPLVTVMDTSSLIAKLHLAQAVAQRMKVGDAAAVTVPGVSDPLDGRVSLISPALDPGSTTVEVWVQLKNPDGALKVGTPVHVAIVGRTVQSAVQVPTSALLTREDGSLGVMLVASDGRAHLKPVTVGIRLPNEVQIVSGVGPDDVVITSGGYGLDDGTKVKVGAADEDKS